MTRIFKRLLSTAQEAAESAIAAKLKTVFKPSLLSVQDISGGCGSMYQIVIHSDQFKGLTTVKQHRLVNQVLSDDIKNWHGVRLETKSS